MRQIATIGLLAGAGLFVFSGCATQNSNVRPKIVYKVEKSNYILKSDAKVKKAVAMLIVNQKKINHKIEAIDSRVKGTEKELKVAKDKINKVDQKQISIKQSPNIKEKIVKTPATPYDKVILDFVKKR